jgi:hypothetical protein
VKARKASRRDSLIEDALIAAAIRTADSERLLAAAAPALDHFQPGDLVLHTGLGSSEKNGATGTVVGRVARRKEAAERWLVDVPAHGRSFRFPPANLRRVSPSAPAATPSPDGIPS